MPESGPISSADAHHSSGAIRDEPSSVLGKVRVILEAFDHEHQRLGTSALARATGLPKSTLHRLCGALVEWGLLQRRDTEFELGLRLFELGIRVPTLRTLRDAALPYMEQLHGATRQTVHLGVRDACEIVYIEKINGEPVPAPSRIGHRLPLYCTALGKAILAFSPPPLFRRVLSSGLEPRTPRTLATPERLREELDSIRKRGIAYERGESAPGVVCAAAPLFSHRDAVIGALSLTADESRRDPESLGRILQPAAESLSAALRWRSVLLASESDMSSMQSTVDSP